MIFSDVDIKALLASGELKIVPLAYDQIGGASIDLTLSDEWYVFKKGYLGSHVDLKKVDFKRAMKKVKSRSITLKPQEMCLGKTLEKLTLPTYVMGTLEGRSRYARMGLAVHITSALVQPGSDNHQVLEIVNFAPFAVTLHAGMRISQVVFEYLTSPTSRPYARFGTIAKKQ